MEPNLCYKSIKKEESEGEKDTEGTFDLTTRQFHGLVVITTPGFIEIAHMAQGQIQGESVRIETTNLVLLSLAHKLIANEEWESGFKASYLALV